MNAASDSPPRFLGLSPVSAAILAIALATAVRFVYCAWLPILPDEAYYFQWSRHLDASYISKGPAVAYTIAAGTALFGDNAFGIRFFAVLLSAGTAWQMFRLARRCYDETTALIAVLITGVVPIYALGAVVMTIDPLSAFFWVWAANLFSRAVWKDRLRHWLLAGFAVGCGFLAKYLNALELAAFLAFLLLVPARRRLLARPGFWLMLAVTAVCTAPVWWWNWRHGWVSAAQLENRGHLNGPFEIHFSTFLNFLGLQAVVISPLLFLALLITAAVSIAGLRKKISGRKEGELLLVLLFLPVFLMYAVLAWHMRCEPNWPAVSYLTLIIIMAAQWRKMISSATGGQPFIVAAFVLAWLQTLLMHNPEFLHLPQKMDPMSRVAGWSEIAAHLNDLRAEEHADALIADAYKEASVLSFHLPDKAFIYTLRSSPPANQYDLWPGYAEAHPKRALWITGEPTAWALRRDFNTITLIERVVVSFHGEPFREYAIYLCENR
ncbi:MAG TPA: glycosyltransferase family 39 protein [Candidatus Methylacidiphilales bacterium]|jgi:4-amino-4-deoxy-L-arabinose transferase-like glycosyltransferase|nr:glycosyltransferase family 39 protein [Candidatus Methylacidiphilales bacterium]